MLLTIELGPEYKRSLSELRDGAARLRTAVGAGLDPPVNASAQPQSEEVHTRP